VKEAEMEDQVMEMAPKVEQLISMLSSIDPRRDSFAENEQLQSLYNQTLAVRPKLVKLIEKYSLKKDELVALNEKFMKARTSYDKMLENSIARYSSPPSGKYRT
jgi:signal transducing adaptor molecule